MADFTKIYEYFVLGYWRDFTCKDNREYYWMSGLASEEEAKKAAKLKQDYGQPKYFPQWMRGKNKIFNDRDEFIAAARKADVIVHLEDISAVINNKYSYYEEQTMFTRYHLVGSHMSAHPFGVYANFAQVSRYYRQALAEEITNRVNPLLNTIEELRLRIAELEGNSK